MKSSSRSAEPLVDDLLQHGVDLLAGLVDHRHALRVGVRRRADDAVLQGDELLGPVERQAEQLEEHGGGQRLGDRLVEVAVPVAGHRADQVLDQRAGAVLEEGDALRREERVEQLAEVLVLGRVDLQRDERPDLADLHGVEARS